jgi:methionine-rich copper-binding protein CopC
MSSKFSTGLSLLVLALISHDAGTRVWAHAYPAISLPADGATLKEPPREVRIQFTEGLELAFSQIVVKGPNAEIVSQGKLRRLAEDTAAIDLKTAAPGELRRGVASSVGRHTHHRRRAAVHGRCGRTVT